MGRELGKGERTWERGKKKGRGDERAPAIRAPFFSILWLLAAAKFRLANQTIEGEAGCHSMLLHGDCHGHVIESFI